MVRASVVLLVALFSLIACGGDGGGEEKPEAETRRFEILKRFTIELPEGWSRSFAPGAGGFHFVSPEADESPDFQENIGFARVDVPEDGDPRTMMNVIKRSMPSGGLALVEGEEATLEAGGNTVLRMRVHRESNSRSYLQYYVVPLPDFAIRITATTPDVTLEKYRPLFDAIVESLTVKDS